MALTGVPWFIGGGAEHSPEVARLLAYAAMGGGNGVIGPADFRVEALPVPGRGVRVLPGAAAIESLSAQARQQSYLVHGATATDVMDFTDTSSAGSRSDLLYVSVEDPFAAGETWDEPDDLADGPYVHFRVLEGVPESTTRLQEVPGYSTRTGYAVALITRGPSTGTITSAAIKDLRVLARARSRTIQLGAHSGGGTDPNSNYDTLQPATPNVFQDWPTAASWDVRIPEWATHAIIRGSVESYAVKAGSVTGRITARFLDQYVMHASYDVNRPGGSNPERGSLGFGGEVVVSAANRGTIKRLRLSATRGFEVAGYLDADGYTSSFVSVTFEERTT